MERSLKGLSKVYGSLHYLKAQGLMARFGELVVEPRIGGHFDAAEAPGPSFRGVKEPPSDAAPPDLLGDVPALQIPATIAMPERSCR